jgi:pimeloyl-ACP methyl ester carboxylesterase
METKSDYTAFCYKGAKYKVEYNDLMTGVELMTVVFEPPEPGGNPPVVFIPGLVSIIENFREVLIELTRSHTVYYLETREKRSARVEAGKGFTVDDIAIDIVRFAELKFAGKGPYILAGYSLGATAIIGTFSISEGRPEAVILVEPNGSFPFNGWLLALARIAKYVYRPVKPFLKWYLRTFVIDLERDEEMYLINCRNLDTAVPERLGKAVRDLSHYHIGDASAEVCVPSLVVVASGDRFHSHAEGVAIARQIKNSLYLDMEDNRRTHSTAIALEMDRFISSLAQRSFQEDLL